MAAVLVRTRADLRARWRSWLALALLVGLFAGGVTGVVAGARRTDSSFRRFLAAWKAPDVFVSNPPGEQSQSFATLSFAEVARLPGVVQTGRAAGYAVIQPPEVGVLAAADHSVGG